MPVDATIVVVVHDSADTLDRCLNSVPAAAGAVSTDVLVVDSGSSDDPQAVCARHDLRCQTVSNRGLAAAFNHALTSTDARASRYLLQLNPDVELHARALERLIAYADEHPHCGILAPRQIDQHGRPIHSIGREPSGLLYLRRLADAGADWVQDPEQYKRDREADWVMGACMLLRSEMLAEIGGFDERFFLFSEEVDLCRRAREAGWSVRFTPSATVAHPIADRLPDEHRIRLEEWSRIIYLRKWHSPLGLAWTRLVLALRFSVLAARDVRHRTPIQRRAARLRLRATLRFGGGKYGPPPVPAS